MLSVLFQDFIVKEENGKSLVTTEDTVICTPVGTAVHEDKVMFVIQNVSEKCASCLFPIAVCVGRDRSVRYGMVNNDRW